MLTKRWFFAAARTMVGPPMSMFSMASSSEQSGPGDGRCKRVEVYHHHVDRLDAVRGHDAVILAAAAQNAAVHLGVQGFDPAVHHFGEAGVVRHFGDVQALFLQQAVGAAGGQQFHAHVAQGAGELDNARLVGDADQGAFDLDQITITHAVRSPSPCRRSGCTA